jgi:uncharacterized Zn-binding protein involved in type VI secretion
MRGISKIGDTTTGHAGFPPQNILTGKSKVLINGIPVATIGDALSTHCNPSSCHSSVVATGSTKVFVSGVPVAGIGDATSCGDTIATGSTKVLMI